MSIVALLGCLYFAGMQAYRALTMQSPDENDENDGDTTTLDTAQNLVMEQAQLWSYTGERTGAYYAKQRSWTLRARAYVASHKLNSTVRKKADVPKDVAVDEIVTRFPKRKL